MTMLNVQPFWPPLEPEEREKAVENAARHMLEVRRMAWTYMLKQTLGFWELPARQQLIVLADGITRMRDAMALDPALAGTERADVAFFEALRAIDAEESNAMLKRYVELVERYVKQGANGSTPIETEDVYA